MIQLLAFDLDGTTLDHNYGLSARNEKALKAAAEKGVLLVPATGRNRGSVPDVIADFPEIRYLVTSNGANIFDKETNEVLYSCTMPNAAAQQVYALTREYHLHMDLYIDGKAYTTPQSFESYFTSFGFKPEQLEEIRKDYIFIENYDDFFLKNEVCPEKINLNIPDPELYRIIAEKLQVIEGIDLSSSYANALEMNNAAISKGKALHILSERLGIDAKNMMAIGDGGNDLDMLAYAGYSFAMANGTDQAKKAARFMAGHCDEDGLAEAIEAYILNNT